MAARFRLIGELLYKQSFSSPYPMCLSLEEVAYVLREIHEGACGAHIGGPALAKKATRASYFWPKMKEAAEDLDTNSSLLREALDEVDEVKDKAYLRMEVSKHLLKKAYDKRVKKRNFQEGDLVLRQVDALKPVGKLEANWEGPY
ncbi:hypothetical protein DH2020_046870 [Rehmannia glutinosa]|uniref:Integrase zinc-binding domain-containing protein n=1 Tax=Rehmannia glutinosa TaxID=99300 RepID=A0ABR0UAY2_REHGL